MSWVESFARDEKGASLVEYSILIGLVAVTTVALIQAVGVKIRAAWCSIDANWMRLPHVSQCDGSVTIETSN